MFYSFRWNMFLEPQKRRKGWWKEAIFEEIIANNFPKQKKQQINKVLEFWNRINKKEIIFKHTVAEFLKIKCKEKILKTPYKLSFKIKK